MNADDIANLRSRGARLGEVNVAQWRELVTAYSLEKVRYAIAQVKIASRKDQVIVEEVAAHLKHKLRAVASPAKPKAEQTPVQRADSELERLKKAEASTTRKGSEDLVAQIYTAALQQSPGITQAEISTLVHRHVASVSVWLSQHKDLVDCDGGLPRRYWLKGQKPDGIIPQNNRPESQETSAPKRVDYLGILRKFGPITAVELGARAGTSKTSVRSWLVNHAAEIAEDFGKPARYRVREEGPDVESAPAATAAVAPDRQEAPASEPSLPRRERESSPDERSAPISEQEAAAAPPSSPVGEQAPWTTPEGIPFKVVPAHAASMTMPTTTVDVGHLPARPTLAFTVTLEEMDGELTEIVHRLLDCYSDRHGFAKTYRQTARVLRALSPSETAP